MARKKAVLLRFALYCFFLLIAHRCVRSLRHVLAVRASRFHGNDWLGIPNVQDISLRHVADVHFVISYCDGNLAPVWDSISQLEQKSNLYRVRSKFLYSKCSHTLTEVPHNFRVVKLANVGRCDHTSVYHIVNNLYDEQDLKLSDVVLFLKDTSIIHQPGESVPYHDLIRRVKASDGGGFACGLVPSMRAIKNKALAKYQDLSAWHDTRSLLKFKKASYRNIATLHQVRDGISFDGGFHSMKDWWKRAINVEFKEEGIVQVCYGGVFAANVRSVRQWDKGLWIKIKNSLERGDNIEEGHFMERTWAFLLAPSPSEAKTQQIFQMSNGVLDNYTHGLLGTLYRCNRTNSSSSSNYSLSNDLKRSGTLKMRANAGFSLPPTSKRHRHSLNSRHRAA